MKEIDIDILMKESLVSPSKGFTDRVMTVIETKKEVIRPTILAVVWSFLACAGCLLLAFKLELPSYKILNQTITIPHNVVGLAVILFVAYQLYQLYMLITNILKIKRLRHARL